MGRLGYWISAGGAPQAPSAASLPLTLARNARHRTTYAESITMYWVFFSTRSSHFE
jgi:hypothetical protein